MRTASAAIILLLASLGCAKKDEPKSSSPTYRGTLAVDIRQSIDVTLIPSAVDVLDVTLVLGDGNWTYMPAATKLAAKGRVERFPEASMVLYAASFPLTPSTSGACGGSKMNAHLSLSRRLDNARVGGALTIYCGEGAATGQAPARIFRLSGSLSFAPPA